jgi:hypothetical protein
MLPYVFAWVRQFNANTIAHRFRGIFILWRRSGSDRRSITAPAAWNSRKNLKNCLSATKPRTVMKRVVVVHDIRFD